MVMHGYEEAVELHNGHVHRQNSHQKLREPSVFLMNGGTAVAQAQAKDPDLCIGRPIAFHPEVTPPPPPERLHQASQILPGRASENRLLADHHQCAGKRLPKLGESHIGERRWCVVGCSERHSHVPK